MIVYAARALKAEAEGDLIVFKGICLSACTMLLYVSNKCIGSKRVTFGFHLPYDPKTGKNDPEAAEFIMDFYPAWVKLWLANNGGLQRKMTFMSSAYAERFIRKCEKSELLTGGSEYGRKIYRPKDGKY